MRFGRLVAICPTEKRSAGRCVIWLCRCDCGNLKEISGKSLRQGLTKSCGCLNREKASERTIKRNYKHGYAFRHSVSRLYWVWQGIKSRCYYPKNTHYRRYGKRGIGVCLEWKDNYLAFKKWASTSGYKKGLVIDRINNNGNYEPSNCRWITISENAKHANLIRWTGIKNEAE